jgi:hypothetical protein
MPVELFGKRRAIRPAARKIEEDEGMVLILLLLLLISGGGTYYAYRNYGKYGGLVPAMLVILLIYLLVGTAHFH